MATHSSVPVWRIPGTEEPGGLPSMGSHRVGHDWSDLAAVAPIAGRFFTIEPPKKPMYIYALATKKLDKIKSGENSVQWV